MSASCTRARATPRVSQGVPGRSARPPGQVPARPLRRRRHDLRPDADPDGRHDRPRRRFRARLRRQLRDAGRARCGRVGRRPGGAGRDRATSSTRRPRRPRPTSTRPSRRTSSARRCSSRPTPTETAFTVTATSWVRTPFLGALDFIIKKDSAIRRADRLQRQLLQLREADHHLHGRTQGRRRRRQQRRGGDDARRDGLDVQPLRQDRRRQAMPPRTWSTSSSGTIRASTPPGSPWRRSPRP